MYPLPTSHKGGGTHVYMGADAVRFKEGMGKEIVARTRADI